MTRDEARKGLKDLKKSFAEGKYSYKEYIIKKRVFKDVLNGKKKKAIHSKNRG